MNNGDAIDRNPAEAPGRLSAPLIALGGVALLLCGFLWDLTFAGIPYQDPTPEMQARYDFHRTVADGVMLAGVAGIAGGLALGLRRKLARGSRP